MTKDEILKSFINSNGKVKSRQIALAENDVKDTIISLTSFLPDNVKFSERLYCIAHGLRSVPKCSKCQVKEVPFYTFVSGYRDRCGDKACHANEHKLDRRKRTSLKKYGFEHPAQNVKVKDKTKKTNRNRYGADYYWSSNKSKIRKKIDYLNNSKFKDTLMNRDWCEEMRLEKKMPAPAIADLINTTPESVCNYLKKHGIFEPMSPGFISTGHLEMSNFLKDLDVDHVNNARGVVPNMELDIYCPDQKVAFEYNGLYWHSEDRVGKNYHQRKYLEAKEQGIALIQFFDTVWLSKKEICKSIIRAKLGKIENKIYARNTSVRYIEPKEARLFLDDNHLDGFSGAAKHIGLYHNDQLVSVMSIGKHRFKADTNEIVRFASRINTLVIGGMSKMTKFHGQTNIESYSDNMLGNTSSLYESVTSTDPGYFYFNPNKGLIKSRYQCQKHRLTKLLNNYDKELTEYENMTRNGWVRVWDAGNTVKAVM